jgi:hypothetical protein
VRLRHDCAKAPRRHTRHRSLLPNGLLLLRSIQRWDGRHESYGSVANGNFPSVKSNIGLDFKARNQVAFGIADNVFGLRWRMAASSCAVSRCWHCRSRSKMAEEGSRAGHRRQGGFDIQISISKPSALSGVRLLSIILQSFAHSIKSAHF